MLSTFGSHLSYPRLFGQTQASTSSVQTFQVVPLLYPTPMQAQQSHPFALSFPDQVSLNGLDSLDISSASQPRHLAVPQFLPEAIGFVSPLTRSQISSYSGMFRWCLACSASLVSVSHILFFVPCFQLANPQARQPCLQAQDARYQFLSSFLVDAEDVHGFPLGPPSKAPEQLLPVQVLHSVTLFYLHLQKLERYFCLAAPR
mmetsp:Transcript_43732/g.69959  ORF Transcript_43732/g.69959 Transcript_43732/m.69959 type:complete len:202 (+) Transcript_43732:2245-2850(+)